MRRDISRAFKQAFVYGGAVAAGKAIGFVMIPVYTRVLSPADYGAIELLDLTTSALGIALAMGLNAAVIRHYFLAQDDGERNAVVGTAAVFCLGVALLAGLALAPAAPRLGLLVAGSRAYGGLFLLAVLTNVFDAATVVPLAWLRARERARSYSIVHLARVFAGLALNIWLVVFLRMGVRGVMISGLAVAVISGITLTCAVIGGTRRARAPLFSPRVLAGMLRYGLPLVPASLSMFVLHFSDRLFLQRWASMSDVGLYGLAYKFAMTLPFLVGQPLGLMWGPFIFDLSRRPGGAAVIARATTYFIAGMCAYAVALSALIPDLVRVVAAPRFFAAAAPVPALMIGMVLLAAVTLFESGLLIRRRTELRAVAVGAGAAVNLVANIILIPRLGMMGAAWATTAGCAVTLAASAAFSRRAFAVPYEWGRLAKLGAASLLAFAAARCVPASNGWLAAAGHAAGAATLLAWLWMMRFFQPNETSALRAALRWAPGRAKAAEA